MADTVRRCRPVLGTFVEIAAEADAEAIEQAFAAIGHVHARMSFHEAGSDLARLRCAPWGTRVAVDPGTIAVLRLALALHAQTDGLFDVAIGARLVAAGFLPRPDDTDLRRMTGTSADIEIDGTGHVRCHRPLLIDLGGIAKGFAVDRAVEALVESGAAHGCVDAGGDLRVFGPVARTIAVRGADGRFTECFDARDIAVATSSNLHDRRRSRGRIATPHRGRDGRALPIDHSITVTAGRCIVADAFTKIAMADPALAASLIGAHGGALFGHSRAVAA